MMRTAAELVKEAAPERGLSTLGRIDRFGDKRRSHLAQLRRLRAFDDW
jgi:hypothetical protein